MAWVEVLGENAVVGTLVGISSGCVVLNPWAKLPPLTAAGARWVFRSLLRNHVGHDIDGLGSPNRFFQTAYDKLHIHQVLDAHPGKLSLRLRSYPDAGGHGAACRCPRLPLDTMCMPAAEAQGIGATLIY
jgi:hypothetical protein